MNKNLSQEDYFSKSNSNDKTFCVSDCSNKKCTRNMNYFTSSRFYCSDFSKLCNSYKKGKYQDNELKELSNKINKNKKG